ncbi:endo alpha-1,4 polygalactosaminidase [Streptomyces gamaensis]|uniref:Endo alpha-1,4 polygalactosaminidase n=1 Tax=Streptomyces gamaensis TaxID=1763542 RepID=A0ABW0Z2J0_9ACTN
MTAQARTRRRLAALTAAGLLALAGCSSGGGSAKGGSETRTDRTAPGTPPSSSAAPTPGRSPQGTPGGSGADGHWRPRPGTAWQWQLDGAVDTSVDAPVYDIDGFENDARTVARLHDRGRKVICYINAGAWEDFRDDHDAFPESLLGAKNKGWKGEKWLDIRRLDVLAPLMGKRMDMCREKGFDAVEPDLTEGFRNNTGFPLTAADQLAFNRMLARQAHERGLAVGLKNDLEQVPQLVGDFDFAVNEQCAQFKECDRLRPFAEHGKPVFHVEYELPKEDFCAGTRQLGFSSMRKKLGLDAWREPC